MAVAEIMAAIDNTKPETKRRAARNASDSCRFMVPPLTRYPVFLQVSFESNATQTHNSNHL